MIGRVACTGPPFLCILLLMINEGGTEPCEKCYYPLYAGESRTAVLRFHTNPSPNCINFSSVTTCIEDRRVYWLFENIGNFKQKLLGECPMKEKWICSEKKPKKRQVKHRNYESDLIKEKEIKGVIKKGPEIPTLGGKNLFLDLAQKISHEFNISNCWICGDTRMAEIWPWEGIPMSPQDILRILDKEGSEQDSRPEEEVWNLRSEVIGEECLWRRHPEYTVYLGEIYCKRYLVLNETYQWWIPKSSHLYWSRSKRSQCSYIEREKLYECPTREPNPFWDAPQIAKFWNKTNYKSESQLHFWRAPKNLYWLCGKRAYVVLPKGWAGSCTLGIIRPSFFLLPRIEGYHLGVPLYDELARKRGTCL